MEDGRNVGENSCNIGDGTDQTGPILDVYDDDDYAMGLTKLLMTGKFYFYAESVSPCKSTCSHLVRILSWYISAYDKIT